MTLKENLIIPKGYQINIPAGVGLILNKGVKRISQSPFNIQGTKENPVTIEGKSDSEGIYIYNSPKKSFFSNLKFLNLGTIKDLDWELSGPVTFYNTSVSLNSVHIDNNNSEDSLNIKNSKFTINDLIISNTP